MTSPYLSSPAATYAGTEFLFSHFCKLYISVLLSFSKSYFNETK